MIVKVVVLTVLAICGVEDLRSMKIHLLPVCAGLVLGLLLAFAEMERYRDFFYLLLSLLPGASLLTFSFLTREAIGVGDGLLFLMIGSLLGLEESLILLTLSLMLSLFAALGIWIKKKSKKAMFPFVPIVLLSYVFMLWVEEMA
jgi:leader peptidase (prepilin peptidase) / N-methyltransferase